MKFTSFVSLTPFDEHVCEVEAVFLPGDKSVRLPDEWDLFVTIDGKDVTYDISNKDFDRLMEETWQHAKDHADEMMIDQWEYDQEYDKGYEA